MKTQLMALIGEAQAGKDTVCKMMIGLGLPAVRYAFADQLKADLAPFVRQHYGLDVWSEEAKPIIRDLLVAHGRCKRLQHPDHWIVELAKRMVLREGSCAVITDCRYLNEATWVKARGGLLVRIERPGFGPANDEERASLRAIDSLTESLWLSPYKHLDGERLDVIHIVNDGSLDDLRQQVIGRLAWRVR